jgi:hypothetical protein
MWPLAWYRTDSSEDGWSYGVAGLPDLVAPARGKGIMRGGEGRRKSCTFVRREPPPERAIAAARREPSRESDRFPASDGVARFPCLSASIGSGPSEYSSLPNAVFFLSGIWARERMGIHSVAWIRPESPSIPTYPNEASR